MNAHDLLRTKNRRKTVQNPSANINLDLSKLNNPKMKVSISARKINQNNKNYDLNNLFNHNVNKKIGLIIILLSFHFKKKKVLIEILIIIIIILLDLKKEENLSQ